MTIDGHACVQQEASDCQRNSFNMQFFRRRSLYLFRKVLQPLLADHIGNARGEFLGHLYVPNFETSG